MIRKALLFLAVSFACLTGALSITVSPPVQSWAQGSGVTSLGGMVGAILCGAHITCSGGTISLTQLNSEDINCLPTAAGAGTINCRTELYSRGVSVLNYGAACDGSTDDSTPFQVALNNNRRVIVPPGRTCVLTTIAFNVAQTTLEGGGDGSILYQKNGANTTFININAPEATLKNLQVYGNAGNQVGTPIAIAINNQPSGRYEDLFISETAGQVFSIVGANANYNLMARNRITNCQMVGRMLNGASYNVFRDSYAYNCGLGIEINDQAFGFPTSYNKIINNTFDTFTWSTNLGIEAVIAVAGPSATFNLIDGNSISNVTRIRGVEGLDSPFLTVTNNTFRRVGTDAAYQVSATIDVGPLYGAIITGNNITEAGGSAVFSSGTLRSVFSNNNFMNHCLNPLVASTGGCAGFTVNFDPSFADDNTFIGNHAQNNNGSAGYLEWSGSAPNYNRNIVIGNNFNQTAGCIIKGTNGKYINNIGAGCP